MGLFTTLSQLVAAGNWPPKDVRPIWEDIELLAAFRTNDRERLMQEASVPWNKPYVIAPVPRMISRASANLLFSEAPEIGSADDGDAERYAFIEQENGLSSEFQRGALISSSEGEVWGKVVVDPSLLDAPIIEFVSRGSVIPWFRGRFIDAVTFVTMWATSSTERWRLFETYGAGYVQAELFRGGRNSIGQAMPLDSFGATRGMLPRIDTGVPYPLAVFIPNSFDVSLTRGYSDYRGLEDRFLAVNESATIGQANVRLSGKKRALVDGDYLDARGRLNKDDDLLIRKNRNVSLGDGDKPLQLLEYQFEADQLVRWLDHMIDTTLVFAGTSPQSVGRGDVGVATSGTALKLRMAHSLMEGAGKGRHFDRGAKRLLRAAAAMDKRYFGRPWSDVNALPSFERQDGLPQDDFQASQIVNNLVAAEAISPDERVRYMHPDWTQQQIDDEVAAIDAATPTAAPPGTVPPPPVSLNA